MVLPDMEGGLRSVKLDAEREVWTALLFRFGLKENNG